MKTPSGRVFDISRGCVDDGPGLRTVVFLKGCSLGCPWCHNPEGLSPRPQVGYDETRCIHCGRCAEACPRSWSLEEPDAWRAGCLACGRCVDACPSGARRLVGRGYEPAELVRQVLEDRDFFAGTGGGVTFSGGEPLLQAEFLFACAERLSAEGVHVAVETAGLWPGRLLPALVDKVDLILFDLKHCEPDKLRETLGCDCTVVLENLDALLQREVELELRLTLVPGFNAAAEDLLALARWLRGRRRIPPVRLQSFHRLAAAKARLYDASYPFADVPPISRCEIAAAAELLQDHAVPVMEP